MASYFCDTVLLDTGWASDTLIHVDSAGTITRINTEIQPTQLPPVTEYRHLRGSVLPGMPNLHSHAHQRAIAGLAEYAGTSADSFWTWREIMYRAVLRLSPDDLEAIAAQLYCEMLEAGFTHVCEFQYLHHDVDGQSHEDIAEMSVRCIRAAQSAGIGITILPVMYAYGGFGKQPPSVEQRRFINTADSYQRIVEALDKHCVNSEMVHVGLAPHSLRACDGDVLRDVLDLQRESVSGRKRPVHIHIAEQQSEVDDCIEWSGKRPVEWLCDEVQVDEHWCLIHATHTQEHELTAMAKSDCVAGLCPSTEANLGDGFFDAVKYAELNGRFGIGSDSQISVSPVEELRWLEYGQRLCHTRRNVMPGRDLRSTGRYLYERAVAGGQQAAGSRGGPIKTGNRADLVLLNDHHPLLYGRSMDRLIDSFLFSGNRHLVETLMVNGRIVVEHGCAVNAEQIASNYRAAIDRLQLLS